jgi:Domain of unknown function (DUF4365)
MPKYVGKSTIVDHKGLAKLKTFCANSRPFLVCRDETITDVGIDGEIEICFENADGKTEASGERIKFQLKSTDTDNSYMRSEDETSFKFYASKDDVEYWAKHKQDVLLIIYDGRNDILYAKKITENDYKSQSQTKKNFPITFHKEICLISENNFDFHKKYSVSIKERLCFDLKEPALTNLFKVRKFPKYLYTYKTKFSNKESIFKSLGDNEISLPEFVIYNKIIYTFVPPENQPQIFIERVIESETEKIIDYTEIASDKNLRNHFVEVIKLYFKKYLGSRGIYFNKDHKRYYFRIREGEAVRSIFAKTRKRGKRSPKEVAKFYTYGKYQFFRHVAFRIDFLHSENIYICITPTYLLTSDGKNSVDGKTASKFIIAQKNLEHNPQVADRIHAIFSYLAQDNDDIILSNKDNIEIEISSYVPLTLPFSISTDDKGFPQYLKKQKEKHQKQLQANLYD